MRREAIARAPGTAEITLDGQQCLEIDWVSTVTLAYRLYGEPTDLGANGSTGPRRGSACQETKLGCMRKPSRPAKSSQRLSTAAPTLDPKCSMVVGQRLCPR